MNLTIVIVTYNRLEKLIKTLKCYDNQTVLFNSIVIVDNCSTDGTVEYLKKWSETNTKYEKYVIYKQENSGGAGGFYEGQRFALTLNPDWIYVSDDDAYPALDMVERFNKIIENIDINKTSAICGAVYQNNGSIDYEHRRTYSIEKKYKFIEINSNPGNYKEKFFHVNIFSYVGSFINALALKEVGLCNPSLFIYYDDSEHSLRLLKYGSILCFPELKIIHDSGFGGTLSENVLYTWRNYYSLRNYINALKKHYPISAVYVTLKYIYHILKTKEPKTKLIVNSLIDGWLDRLGKHKIYKPGFVKEK